MKYRILINQAGVVMAGLHHRTDLTDWALLNHIYDWETNKRAYRIENKVWINYRNVIEELPLIHLNSKSAVANRINKLRHLELILTSQAEDYRLFVETTELYVSIRDYRAEPE